MQGQRSALGSLPELSFHHGSATTDSSIDPQRCWNNMRDPAEDQLPDCLMSSSNASLSYLNSARQEGHGLSGWSIGEASSGAAHNPVNPNDPMRVRNGAPCVLRERQYGSSLSLNLNGSLNTEQAANGRLFMQGSTSLSLPLDHNTNPSFAGYVDDNDEDCQVIECVSAFRSGSSNEPLPGTNSFGTPSGNGGYIVEEGDHRSGSSLDGRRLSCKRKTVEESAGQSSGSGSSIYEHDAEGNFWPAPLAYQNAASSIPPPSGSNIPVNLSDQVHPSIGLSFGGTASEGPQAPQALSASESTDTSRRNFRLRINGSHPQDRIPGIVSSTESVGGSSNALSAQRSLRLPPVNNSLDLGQYSVAESGSVQRPTVGSLRRNAQSRWYRASSSRAGSSSYAISGDRVAMPHEEPNTRIVPRDISEHPMFIRTSEMGNSSQNPVNWGVAAGNIGIAGNVASSSRAGSSSGVNLPAPSLASQRNSAQYSRRLSEFVRRSMLTSTGTETGSPSSSYPMNSGASSSQDMLLPAINYEHNRYSRSAILLERHLGRATEVPYAVRAAGEGRSRLVSEIRSVLDMMRRGEGMRYEDVMMLDQSVIYGMADLHDRYRDMRLDVDNMSYEELLALEERIGNVCTGLNEETISSKLKQSKYVSTKTAEKVETEPCCVCQEEYNEGDDLGTLECGHGFHSDCIKQWLLQKNLCPICKTTGLTK